MHYLISTFTLLTITGFFGYSCKTLDNNNELKVIGAREVAKKDYPSVAAIVLEQPMTNRYKIHCTIARVGEYTFITSARCIYNIHTNSLLPFFQKGSELTIYYGKSWPEDTHDPESKAGFSENSGSTFLTDSTSDGELRKQTLEIDTAPTQEQIDQMKQQNDLSSAVQRYLVPDMGAFYLSKVRVSEVYLPPSFLKNYKHDEFVGTLTKTFVSFSDLAFFKITPELRIPKEVLPYSKVSTDFGFHEDQAEIRIGGYSYSDEVDRVAQLRYEKFSKVKTTGYFYKLNDPSEARSIKMPSESKGGPVFLGDKKSPYQKIVGINSQYNGEIHLSRFNFTYKDDKNKMKNWISAALGQQQFSDPVNGPYKATETTTYVLECKNSGTQTSEKLKFEYGAKVSAIYVKDRHKTKKINSVPNKINIDMIERSGHKSYSSTLYLDQLGSLQETLTGGYKYNFQYLGYDNKLNAYLLAEIIFSPDNRKYRLTVKAFLDRQAYFAATAVLNQQTPDEVKKEILNSKSRASQVLFDSLCDMY